MSSLIVAVKDEGRLAELGYYQQLQRDWGFIHNFGVSFSIIVRKMAASAAIANVLVTS